MFQSELWLLLWTEGPVHVAGTPGPIEIDAPIARRAGVTPEGVLDPRGEPILPFSSVRGALRDVVTDQVSQLSLFGVAGRPGAGTVCDAEVCLFPVSSEHGFAMVSTPRRLGRLCGLLNLARDEEALERVALPEDVPVRIALRHPLGALSASRAAGLGEALQGALEAVLPTYIGLSRRLAIVTEEEMTFLIDSCTDRRWRVSLDNESHVAVGTKLFSLEALPADILLVSRVLLASPRLFGSNEGTAEDMSTFLKGKFSGTDMTIGGSVTTGMGRCTATILR